MTQSGQGQQPPEDESKSGSNGHKEDFTPEKIYEHVDDDVNYDIDPDTGDRTGVIYNKDIIPEEEGETKNGKTDSQESDSE